MDSEKPVRRRRLGPNSVIFAGSSGKAFAQKMADWLGMEVGRSKSIRFSEGNRFVRADETVRDKHVILVQPIGGEPDSDFVEILFWLDAFKRASASSISVIIPYFSYAKADKKDEPRVSIRARVCAECMELAGADRFMMMDVHSMQVQGFFKKPMDNLLPTPLLCEAVKHLGWAGNLTVVAPDAGGAKRARKFTDYLKLPLVLCDKTRKGHAENNAVIENVMGSVAGKDCLIVDDLTLSGGTLVNLSQTLKAKGAERIFACLSHNIISEEGTLDVERSPIDYVLSTDSFINPNIAGHKKFLTISAAQLFAEALLRDHQHKSVSELFKRLPASLLDAAFANLPKL